ncbi:MAG: flagellin [Proteobacteria bacterium]|nr:flagellin [Pseudomonadota bacterium]
MTQVINTNVMSLNAQRNLATSSGELSVSLQRLSSGLRINGAKDDAAGLAISQRFTAQIRGLSTAIRNAGDAVSLTQTAEGALGSVTSNLQRMRELAVQASNGTNSQVDRDALNAEYGQLRSEVQRVADQTVFAGVKLLDGSFSGVNFQVGANVGEVITIQSLANVSTGALGGTFTRVEGSVAAGSMTSFATAIAAGGLTVNGTSVGAIAAAGSAQERAGQLVSAINAVSATTGVGASYDSATGNYTLSSGAAITVAGVSATVALSGFAAGSVGASTSTTGMNSTNVQSFTSSQQAIGVLDNALTSVNSSRATIGAINSRFDSVISNLRSTTENLSASRSRIQDADFAQETASLTRAQVLQQAGVAMLAQANSAPQSVLSLLR